ncbi:MAG TPA: hypothetical protein VG994_02755 [Steroidobacteraceae bacterium]|nr:hypothetical protein [Steroidobacteraceae bacterium]
MSDEYDWTQDHDWVGDDPEVAADAAKQRASIRDTTRTRQPVRPIGGAIVAQWRCLAEGCTEQCDVTEDAVFALETCNAELARRGEAPIAPAAFCAQHEALRVDIRANRQAERREQMAKTIAQLKASEKPHGETALIALLRRQGHPDVDGLLAALAEHKPRRKGSL